jgi:hypothetical protein
MSERQEHAVFFKELSKTVPHAQIKLADGTTISLASSNELPLEKLNPDQDIYLAMLPYIQEPIYVQTTAKQFIETEASLREMEDFETQFWPEINQAFDETPEKFHAMLCEEVQNGVEGAEELLQEYLEDCLLLALGHKIMNNTAVLVLLDDPEADTDDQKQFPVFRIAA